MNLSSDHQVQKLLSIIHQVPLGLVEADDEGKILQMNAKSVQLLMPLFFLDQLSGDNINELLQLKAPDLFQLIQHYSGSSGVITNQFRQEIQIINNASEPAIRQYTFTVNKLDAGSLMYVFDDVTAQYQKEKQLSQIILDKAIEQNKFEIASEVLHDIGNAIVGFGSYITKIKRLVEQQDNTTLENLKVFIEKNVQAFHSAIGEAKSNALLDLLSGFIIDQENRQTDVKSSIKDQMKIISHVQEILNIQRQYVKGEHADREPVNLRNVLDDTISMLLVNLDKNGISFHVNAPAVVPKLKGDRTKLMQVFLNLFKNAVDSIVNYDHPDKEIKASIIVHPDAITVSIQDSGKGFDKETKASLFVRGYTTKTEGTGLGLANCKSIIEGHNGEIILTSEGIGKGALATVVFQL